MKRQCDWCGRPFEWEGVGRPPKYCRRSHRQRHYEARKEADRLGIGGVLVSDVAWQQLRDAAYRLEAGVVDARADLDENDATGAAEGLLEAAKALLDALPEPVATSD